METVTDVPAALGARSRHGFTHWRTAAIYYGLGVTEHSQDDHGDGHRQPAMATGNLGPRRGRGDPLRGE